MINKIKKINLETLFDLFQQDSMRLDVILCQDDDYFTDVQNLLEGEDRFTLVALEQQDLHNQRTILEGLHQVFFEQLPDENEEVLEIIEAIEDELREDESCLLVVDDFSSCSVSTQAALLELAIVSRAFKLFLKITNDVDFSENEHLWNVLAERSVFLEQIENSNALFEGEDSEQDIFDEGNLDEDTFDENADIQENDFEDVYDEESSFEENNYEENYDQEYETELKPAPTKAHHKTNTQKTAWHQLIPKYHLAAVTFLVIVIILLWNMDVTQKKEELVDLNLSLPSQEKLKTSSIEISKESDEIIQNNSTEIENPDTQINSENDNKIVQSELNEMPSATVPIDEVPSNNIQEEVIKENPMSAKKVLVKDTVKEVLKPTSSSAIIKKIDWSPYQSDAWIKGLNSKYFTLQLMASHDDQGIRNFLQERGVSSQYAVYSSEKNGKPWHVIIYGVYENREFADLARKELPDYLKDYSPWVRNIGEVQNTIK